MIYKYITRAFVWRCAFDTLSMILVLEGTADLKWLHDNYQVTFNTCIDIKLYILAMPRVETRGSQNIITVLNIIVLRKRS